MNLKRHKGFTLIELMIVLAIVAILASFAYPSYQDHVRKTRRSDCEGVMMSAANSLERFYTANGTYASAVAGTNYPNRCPASGAKFYDLAAAVTATTFTLTATPTAGSDQVSDKCKNLTLTSTGQKGTSAAGLSAADCW